MERHPFGCRALLNQATGHPGLGPCVSGACSQRDEGCTVRAARRGYHVRVACSTRDIAFPDHDTRAGTAGVVDAPRDCLPRHELIDLHRHRARGAARSGLWLLVPGSVLELYGRRGAPRRPVRAASRRERRADQRCVRFLGVVLEHGELMGACDRYRGGQTDRTTMLLCGKWMFFYETFGTSGVPASLVSFLASHFPDELGLGFSKLGLVRDPASTRRPAARNGPGSPARDGHPFHCVHVRELPLRAAGRRPVRGGRPQPALRLRAAHPDDLRSLRGWRSASTRPRITIRRPSPRSSRSSTGWRPIRSLKQQLLGTLLPLASLSLPSMTTQNEHEYSTWPTGALDFPIRTAAD